MSKTFIVESDRTVLKDYLRNIFLLELNKPSKNFIIISAYLTDFELIDNTRMNYQILPDDKIYKLFEILNLIGKKRGQLNIYIMKDDNNNKPALDYFTNNQHVVIHEVQALHIKAIYATDYELFGSFNLTSNGINRNIECGIFKYQRDLFTKRVEGVDFLHS